MVSFVDHKQTIDKKLYNLGGGIAQWIAYLLPTKQTGFAFQLSRKISEVILKFLRLIGSTALNSKQRLDNVDKTHLELADGNPLQQKREIITPIW